MQIFVDMGGVMSTVAVLKRVKVKSSATDGQ